MKGDVAQPLRGIRVLAALNSLDLFGHERENLHVLQTLRDMGAEVLLGLNTLRKGGDVGRSAREAGFEIIYLPFGNQWSWLWLIQDTIGQMKKPCQLIRSSLRFYKAIREFRPTHVHLGSSLAYSYLAPALLAWRGPLIFRIGDSPPVNSKFNMLIWRSALRRATRVVAISDFIRCYVARVGGLALENKTTLLYGTKSGVDTEDSANRNKIGFVGQIVQHKGVFELLNAFSELVRSHPATLLEFVGSGAAEEELKRRVSVAGLASHVRFHGYLEHPHEVVKDWSFQVVPSVWDEALGIVVLEAKALGKPVVVFPRGGLPEMVRHQIDGYICREATAEALIEALKWMMEQGAHLTEMGVKALADVNDRFGTERFRNGWTAVYTETLSQGDYHEQSNR